MSFESELHDLLESSAGRFDPDPAVLAEAERRAARMLRARRWRWGLAAAAVVALLAVVGTSFTGGPSPDPPVIGPVPSPTTSDDPTAPEEAESPAAEEPGEPDATLEGIGTWTAISDGPLGARHGAAAVWTGEEVFVWGGHIIEPDTPEGAMYDPASDEWRVIAPAPDGHVGGGVAVWTGREVLVFGGERYDAVAHETDPSVKLLAYDPATDSWRSFDAPPLVARTSASVTWTGEELVVWGGMDILWEQSDGGPTPVEMFADGAAFDPDTGSWRVLADSPLAARGDHGAVWNGRRLIVFGGGTTDEFESEFSWFVQHDDAAAYDPNTDSWSTIASPDQIGPLVGAHWTADRIVYWTGHVNEGASGSWLPPGAVWEPASGDWQPMASPPFLQRRDRTVTVWADELDAMITWGGQIGEGGNRNFPDGALYRPATNTWQRLDDAGLGARLGHIAVWTGDGLVVWGGIDDGSADGGPSSRSEIRGDGATWQP